MRPPSYKGLRLIVAGLLLIVLAGGNLFFGWTEALAEAVQYSQIQAETVSHPDPEPVTAARPTVTDMPDYQKLYRKLAAPTLLPTITSTPPSVESFVPDRIVIPAIKLDAPIVATEVKSVELREQWFNQWQVPDEFAAGWIDTSAPLGVSGNTVLSGHHNEYGKVFGHLVELAVGDTISLYSGNLSFEYTITERMIVKEKDVSLSIRQENARWISPTPDERITLVTCWPKRNNTHRLILVARPVDLEATFPGDGVTP